MNATYKKLPYGISNFETLITENYVYVDKTKYLELLDNEPNKTFFFTRSRKFGKSLFLSMTSCYYDFAKADKFDTLFGNLYSRMIRANGVVRDFYETLKAGTKTVIDRIFLTGIAPVMLDDMTSGFNISNNLFYGKYFIPISEMEVSEGYMDIYLQRTHFYPDMPFDWVWEIKYVKKKDEKNTALIDVKYLSVLFIGKSKVETEKYPLLSCRKK
jgi:hypothetical protein